MTSRSIITSATKTSKTDRAFRGVSIASVAIECIAATLWLVMPTIETKVAYRVICAIPSRPLIEKLCG